MNATELLSRLALILGTGGLYLAGRLDLQSALWVLLVAHLAAALWLLVQLRGDIALSSLFDRRLTGALFAKGSVFALGIFLMLLMGRAGIWIVQAMAGEEALGLWFGVQRLGEMLVEVATAVGIVLFSHGVRAKDSQAAARDAVRMARLVTLFMFLIGLLTSLFAPAFLGIFLGEAYAAQATPFRLVMLGTLAACFNAMLYPTLGSQGLARWGVYAYALGCISAFAATALLVPPMGLAGAALATALAQALVSAVLVIAYRRRFGFAPHWVLLPQREDLTTLRDLGGRAVARLRR